MRNSLLAWTIFAGILFVFINDSMASWERILLKSINDNVFKLRKDIEIQSHEVLREYYKDTNQGELRFDYKDLNIQAFQIESEEKYFVILSFPTKYLDSNINLLAIVNKNNIAIYKQIFEGNVLLSDGIYLWKKQDTEYYRLFLKYHHAVYSGTASGSYSAWEADFKNMNTLLLFSISWPESKREDWPGAPDYKDNIFYLNIKMPTEWYLNEIWGTQCVTADYIGASVDIFQKSAISLEATLPFESLINQKQNKTSSIEKYYSYLISHQSGFKVISNEELLYLLERYPKKVKLIDTRSKECYEISRIPNSILYDEYNNAVSKEGDVVVFYSDIGAKSARILKGVLNSVDGQSFYGKSYNLGGGILAWINAGGKVVDNEGVTNKICLEGEYREFLPDRYIIAN